MIKKWLILLTIMILNINVYAEMPLIEEEPLVSGCAFDVKSMGINRFVEETQKCIEEQTSNSNSIIAKANKRLIDSSVESNQEMIKDLMYILSLALSATLLYWLFNLMRQKQSKIRKSELIMKAVLGIGFIIIINNTDLMKYLSNTLSNKIYSNVALIPTSLSNLYAQSDAELEKQIDPLVPEINRKADSILLSMVESEVCANKVISENMTGYSFDDKYSFEEDQFNNCVSDYLPTALPFSKTGRSPLNAAVKHCSVKYISFKDCGSVAMNGLDEEFKTVLDRYSKQTAIWVDNMDRFNCSLQNKQRAESFCKEWRTDGFKLKQTYLDEFQLEIEFTERVKEFRETWLSFIMDNLDIVNVNRDIRLLSLVDQMYSLLRSENNYEEIAIQANDMLNKAIIVESTERSSSGIEYSSSEMFSTQVYNVEEYYGLITRRSEKLIESTTTNAGIAEKAFGMIKDPITMFGEYENKIDSENFKLDFFVQRNVHDMVIPAILTGAAIKIAAGSLSNVTVNTKKKKTLLWVSQKAQWLMLTPFIALMPLLMTVYVAMNIMYVIVKGMIIIPIQITLLFKSGSKVDVIVKEIVQMQLVAFGKMLGFAFALVMTHLIMAICFKSFDYIEVLKGDKVLHSLGDISRFISLTMLTVILSTAVFLKQIHFISQLLDKKFIIRGTGSNDLIKTDDGVNQTKSIQAKAQNILN